MATQIRPYKVSVDSSQIQQLKDKIAQTTFPDELDNAGWDYGAPLADVKLLATYWKDKFNWSHWERRINEFPTFMATIDIDNFDSVEVHFIHIKSAIKTSVPLLFLHGWPGNMLEVTKLLPLLADSASSGGPAFDIIAPTYPNFGFSSGVQQRGFGIGQYAETCNKLMLALGYEQYVTQGGDWGSVISRAMAFRYPAHVRAIHLNLIIAPPPSPWSPVAFVTFLVKYFLGLYSPVEKAGLERTKDHTKFGMGYFNQQATKPQTLGYLLADSPVGLLAWIYEKLHIWTDGYEWTDEEICAWVSFYWFSRAGPSASTRIYYESARGPDSVLESKWYLKGTKMGLAYFPKEIFRMPKAWSAAYGDSIVLHSEHPVGGHFAAWEQPEAVVGDLRIMFGKGGGAFEAVEGRSGYE